jgi:chromosomal replication initiator protein
VLERVWQDFLQIAREEEGSRVVETWLKAVTLERWDSLEQKVVLLAPNVFVKDWLHAHYIRLFEVHLSRLLNVSSLTVSVESQKKEPEKKSTGLNIVPARQVSYHPARKVLKPLKKRDRSPVTLNANYKFSTFVVGPSNSLAYAAAQAITEKPGVLYNPFFIYSSSGLGKTHLLHAIGNQVKQHNPERVVVYQSADRFVNEFINAIRFNKVHKFKEKYLEIDILLIDDIQFISNKEQTQEAFFHIFNSLYEAGKQIVFSSDTFPRNISGLAERICSRLEWGLVADMQIPSLETRIAILKKKAEANREALSDDVAHFISSRALSNIRELEGSLIRVMAFASLTKQPMSVELAKKVLVQSHHSDSVEVDFERVVRVISMNYSYSLTDLRSKSRNKELTFVRQVSMYLMKKLTKKSLQEIGLYLQRKNHSTVLHAYDKIEDEAQSDEKFKLKLQRMERKIMEQSCFI